MRFLPFLIEGAREVVFGGPFCGGAPYALSVIGRESGQKVTLFYAARARTEWHRRQIAAEANGANIVEVSPGYMSNVQAKARRYAERAGALFLPLGFDVPAAEEPFVEFMGRMRRKLGWTPDEVWCCAGSGMLARCLGKGFPESRVRAVAVGLASRHDAQAFPGNVELLDCKWKFEEEARTSSPFPSCGNYDLKAWEIAREQARGRVLFWNVLS